MCPYVSKSKSTYDSYIERVCKEALVVEIAAQELINIQHIKLSMHTTSACIIIYIS